MKLLYILAALPLLAMAAPAPVPSYYRVKRDDNPVYSKRQLTVADLKRRAETEEDKYKHHHKPSGYPGYPGYYQARATAA